MPKLQLTASDINIGPKDLTVDEFGALRKVVIHAGNSIALELDGWNRAWGTPVVTNTHPSFVTVSAPKAVAGKWVITLKAPNAGVPGVSNIVLTDSAKKTLTPTVVVYAGKFENTPEFEKDLIADAFRLGIADKMQGLIRLLHNHKDNLCNQKSTHNKTRWKSEMACGTVSKVASQKFFNAKADYEDEKKTGGHFHKPILKVGAPTREDITYAPGMIEKVRAAIEKNVRAGMPVLVSVADSPPDMSLKNGMLVHTGWGAHSVAIIGVSKDGKEFLYIDPWPSGSLYTYAGGQPGLKTFDIKCEHLGVFKVMPAPEPTRKFDIIMTRPDTQGTFTGDTYLEVIFGPLK